MSHAVRATRRARLAIGLAMLLAGAAQALAGDEREPLVWRYMDFPPSWIVAGPDRGKGGADRVEAVLVKKMPEYRHERIEANLDRFLALAAGGAHVCSCALLKTPQREANLAFGSIPVGFGLGAGIITTRQRRHAFGSEPAVSLVRMLADERLRVGVSTSRSFGTRVDALLREQGDSPRIVRRPLSELSSGLVHLLMQGRLDYLVSRDHELAWMLHQAPVEGAAGQLAFIPIAESPAWLPSYVACAKTAWGRQVLARIDAILAQEVFTDEYRAIWLEWTTDPELAGRLYDEEFLKEVTAAEATQPAPPPEVTP